MQACQRSAAVAEIGVERVLADYDPFAVGVEVELPDEPIEQINSRVIAVIAGLLAVAVAMVVYLTFIAY